MLVCSCIRYTCTAVYVYTLCVYDAGDTYLCIIHSDKRMNMSRQQYVYNCMETAVSM
jgi:hypothetical protein